MGIGGYGSMPPDLQGPAAHKKNVRAQMHAEHGGRDLVFTVTMSINSENPWRNYYGTVAAIAATSRAAFGPALRIDR